MSIPFSTACDLEEPAMRIPAARFLSAVVIAAGLSTASARAQDAANEKITITAVQLDEYRHKRLVDDKQYVSKNYLSVRMRFKGDAVKKLTRLGHWQISAAKDDQGNDLSKRSSFVSKTLYRTYRRYLSYGKSTPPPQDEYETTHSINAPGRAAKTVAVLKGTVDVSLSDYDTVSIPVSKLSELKGKAISDPALKKAGLSVTLDRISTTASSASLSIKFSGSRDDRQKLLRLRFEDKAGKILSESNASPGFRGGTGSLNSYRKLPADAVLKFDIETNRKDVTLRFDLKDLPLP